MNASLGQPPAGSPGWLNMVWVGIAVLVAVFGRGFGTSVVAGVRSLRAGIAVKESEARQQERELRAEERQATEDHDAALYQRMREQMEDMGRTIAELTQEVRDLREQVRAQYVHEQATMAGLSGHAVWDLAVKTYLPEDYPPPPPLLPPRDQRHSVEWGTGNG